MIGRTIQNYRIEELLGEGGMGTVYRAVDTVLGRDIALKVLHPALVRQSTFLERFRSEARVLARLNHPNVAVLHNFLEVGDELFMVMEYVEGLNLDALLRRRGRLSPTEAVPLIRQALDGLHHAHRRGIVHRDLKPANLMVTPDGQVKVMDFGIAKVVGAQRLTQANHLVGTLEYLSPEQVRGEEPSPASDLYAMGIVLYELLTGRVPFAGESDYTLMDRILREKPTSPVRLNPALPKAIEEILRQALAKNPAERYADARTFSAALAKVTPTLAVDYAELIALPVQEPTHVAIGEKKKTPPPTELVGGERRSGRHTLATWIRVPFQRDFRILTVSVLVAAGLLLGGLWMSPPTPSAPSGEQTAQLDSRAQPQTLVESKDNEQPDPAAGQEKEPAADETGTVPISLRSESPAEKPEETKVLPKRKRLASPTESPTQVVVPEPVPSEPISSAPEPVITSTPTETPRSTARRSVIMGSKLVVLELLDGISSEESNLAGRRLRFRTTRSVVVDGDVVIQAGASGIGEVTEVKSAGMLRRPRLEFRIRSVEGVDGRMIPLRSATFREVATSADAVVRFAAGQTFEVRTEGGVRVEL